MYMDGEKYNFSGAVSEKLSEGRTRVFQSREAEDPVVPAGGFPVCSSRGRLRCVPAGVGGVVFQPRESEVCSGRGRLRCVRADGG